MQRYVVDVKGWTSATDFTRLFAVAQAAPGPNVLITSLIGYRVAGVAGSLVALFALCLPAGGLTWVVSALWGAFAIHHGAAPFNAPSRRWWSA